MTDQSWEEQLEDARSGKTWHAPTAAVAIAAFMQGLDIVAPGAAKRMLDQITPMEPVRCWSCGNPLNKCDCEPAELATHDERAQRSKARSQEIAKPPMTCLHCGEGVEIEGPDRWIHRETRLGTCAVTIGGSATRAAPDPDSW